MKKILLTFLLCLSFLSANEFLEIAKEAKQYEEFNKALEYYYKAAKYDGSAEAIYELGKFFYEGRIVRRNFDKAEEFFIQAANKGYLEARYALGVFYFNKANPKHDYKKAYDSFLALANEGHAPSQNRIGMYLAFGLDTDKDYKEAVKWFQKSADGGYVTGQCHLALMYASGKGVFPNLGRARVLAENGYALKNPVCVHVWDTFKLNNYSEDKGFRLLKN